MVADLSLEHHPLTDLFPRVATREDEEKYRLTEEQVEFFHENGYLKGVKILEEREVDVLREELARLVERISSNDLFIGTVLQQVGNLLRGWQLASQSLGQGPRDFIGSHADRFVGVVQRVFHDCAALLLAQDDSD
jgi:hypothetical protein